MEHSFEHFCSKVDNVISQVITRLSLLTATEKENGI